MSHPMHHRPGPVRLLSSKGAATSIAVMQVFRGKIIPCKAQSPSFPLAEKPPLPLALLDGDFIGFAFEMTSFTLRGAKVYQPSGGVPRLNHGSPTHTIGSREIDISLSDL